MAASDVRRTPGRWANSCYGRASSTPGRRSATVSVTGRRRCPYRERARSARDVARGLVALGLEPGDRVAVLANTRPEWTLVDMGAFCAGAIVAPIYHANSPRSASTCSPTPEPAWSSARTRASSTTSSAFAASARSSSTWSVRGRGRRAAIDPDDIATLIYTSGGPGDGPYFRAVKIRGPARCAAAVGPPCSRARPSRRRKGGRRCTRSRRRRRSFSRTNAWR